MVHDRLPIRALAAEGTPIRAIARDLGISRNTVRRALDPSRPVVYRRDAMDRLDELEPLIRESLDAYPRMPATGVARRIRYSGPMSAFTARVRHVRREVLNGGPRAPV